MTTDLLFADRLASYLYEPNPVKYLQELYSDVDDCGTMSKEDKQEMLTDIAFALNELREQKTQQPGNAPLPTSRRPDDFPEIHFDDDELDFPCGVAETWEPGIDFYWEWYQYRYLPLFHPMPGQDIQHKCLTAIALMNCQATLRDTQKIPLIYFEGNAGSGKSVMADALRSHYPDRLSVEVRPSHTGASLRDELDLRFGSGQPGVVQLDNFVPEEQMAKLGTFYDILLATDKRSSVTRISSRGNDDPKSEFKTHSLKVFTSIWNARTSNNPKMQEVASRCLFFIFKKDDPKYQRDAFRWDGMLTNYRKIWVDDYAEKYHKPYGKALSRLVKMEQKDTPFRGRDFDKVRVPIAVGVMLGMWDLQGGIDAFDKHITWSMAQDTGIQSPFAIVVKNYVKSLQEADSRADDDVYSKAWGLDKTSDVIPQTELFEHIKRVTTHDVGQRHSSEIVVMMSGMGYNHRQLDNRMVFIKE